MAAYALLADYITLHYQVSIGSQNKFLSTSVSSAPTSSPTSFLAIAPVSSETTSATLVSIPLVSLPFLFLPLEHFTFSFETFCFNFFGALLDADLWLLEICGESGVRSVLASLAFGAEAGKIVDTQLVFLVMFEGTVRP